MKGFVDGLRIFSVLLIFIFPPQNNTFAQVRHHQVQKQTLQSYLRNVKTDFLWQVYNPIVLDQKVFEELVLHATIPSYVRVGDVKIHLTNRARHKVLKEVVKNFSSKKSLEKLVTLALMYKPIIEKIFSINKFPSDLQYIMFLESHCVGNAKSDSRDPAIGYWQFKSQAAKWVGLKINNVIDERMNIISSTQGFVKYISNVNKKFDNYVFSIISFYLGQKGCEDMLKRLRIKNSKNLELNHQWHFYIYLFLAYKIVFSKILRKYQAPVRIYGAKNCNGLMVSQICRKYRIRPEIFYIFNRWLKTNRIPKDNKNIILIPLKKKQ